MDYRAVSRRPTTVPAAIVLATFLAIASALALADRGAAADHTIAATGSNTFNPASVTVNVGDRVLWTGITGIHTVTNSGSNWSIDSTTDVERVFTDPGTYDFFCRNHAGMTGSVTVLSGTAGTATPTSSPTTTPPAVIGTPAAGMVRSFVPLDARFGGVGSGDVAIYPGAFYPKSLRVRAGSTVTWVDQGTTHTVTSDPINNAYGLPSFDSGPLSPGQSFSVTFATPGTYAYYCVFHGAPGGTGHAGTIVVE